MLTEMEKIAAFRRNEGPESPSRKSDEQVELVFKNHVRRMLRAERRFSFSTVRIHRDVSARVSDAEWQGLRGAYVTLGDFGLVSSGHVGPKKSLIQLTGRFGTLHDKEKDDLKLKIELLEHQLQCDRSHLQLFRLGAASLFISLLSILFWWRTGVGAPFHPVFAAVVMPVSVGLMAMAFLIKSTKVDSKAKGNT
jgi:hypothetical protein